MKITTYQDKKFNSEIEKIIDFELNRYPTAKFIIDNNSVKVENDLILISKSALFDALAAEEMEIITRFIGKNENIYINAIN